MKEKDSLLTIAIPTIERPSHLERQLTNLCAQYDERIEIIVSDNSTSDNTREVVKTFHERMPNLVYSRNSCDIGFDRNLLKLYEMARSEYIWFLCDDDMVRPGAIGKVIDLISKFEPTVLILGARTDEDGRSADTKDKNCSVKVIDRLEMVEDYRLFAQMIFVSGLVVRKLPDVTIAELSELAGTHFIQTSLCMILLSKIFRICVATGTVVVTREETYVSKREMAFIWFVGPACAMHLPQYGYDMKKVRLCINKSRWGFLASVILAKLGLYGINTDLSIGTADQINKLLGKKTLFFVKTCLILYKIIPSPLLKIFYLLRCVFRFGLSGGIERFQTKTSQAGSTKTPGF